MPLRSMQSGLSVYGREVVMGNLLRIDLRMRNDINGKVDS